MITKQDSLAAVLQGHESRVDTLIELSPVFRQLRHPETRKTMARLTTVEQAAGMAGIDADDLVRRLNGEAAAADVPVKSARDHHGRPAALDRMAVENIIEVDVREDLRTGHEPFGRIMAARGQIPAGGALSVRAIFEPVPLYAVMARQGFDHHTEELGDEDWQVWFYRAEAPPEIASAAAVTPRGQPSVEEAEGVIVLDVRNLEPPEPMVRTLTALAELPAGGTLVQINSRVPQFLLPQLEERGFRYEVREQAPELVRVIIYRAATG
ncbi:MAG: DUF2249 domain-containing protein [Gemmatimonadota bacterium]